MAVYAEACRQRISRFFTTPSSGADGHVSGTVDYDIFGEPVTETGVFAGSVGSSGGISALVFAYAGKPYDSVTGLSDYGFRDYAPTLARFTTVDPIRDGSNWYAYCNADPVNYVDAWGLEDIVIFSAIDVYESFDNALYDLFVHDSYDEIKKAAKEQGLTYRVINGKNATKSALINAYQDDETKRLIVIAHGDKYGFLYDVENRKININLSNPGKNLEIIDAVGCYASTGKDRWNGTNNNIDVRTYNPGCTTSITYDDNEIMYYQTNEVIDTMIPESILNGGKNNTREPTEYSTYRKLLNWIRGSGSHEATNTASQTGGGCEKNNH